MAKVSQTELEPELLAPKRLDNVQNRVTLPRVSMNNTSIVLFYQKSNKLYSVVGNFGSAQSVERYARYSIAIQECGEQEQTASQSSMNEDNSIQETAFRDSGRDNGIGQEPQNPSHHGVKWGIEEYYGDGCNAQTAINNNGVVVLVRKRTHTRKCVYSLGKVTDDRTIEWWHKDVELSNHGVNPSVAIADQTVLFVYEADYGLYRSYYSVGTLDETVDDKMSFKKKNLPLDALNGYRVSSIAITPDNSVVVACRSVVGLRLLYAFGKLISSNDIELQFNGQYASGYYSYISVLKNGVVVEVHESPLFQGLLYKIGRLSQTNRSINWFDELRYDTGYHPSVAVNDNHRVIEVHTSLRVPSRLWHRLGKLSEKM